MYEELAPVFEPKTVAVIGARRTSGPGSFNVVENLDEFGFEGQIYPVNPKADEILGRRAYAEVGEIDDDIDHAIVFLPRHIVTDVVDACGEAGIPAITIVSQGFADAGDDGAEMQEALNAVADRYDLRLIGPNTMGVHDFTTRFTTAFAPIADRPFEPIGVISQTGLFSMSFPGMPYAKFIDIGNAADIDHVDILRYYTEDPEIEQVFLHVEGLTPGRGSALIDAAREARNNGTAVLAMKTGTTEAGRERAESHTGSLMGQDAVFDGAFEQARIQRVQDYTEAQVTSRALRALPPMAGTQIGMITHHGAAMIMALDAIEEFGLTLGTISEETAEAVAELSPDWLDIDNPIDLGPATVVDAPTAHDVAISGALDDPGIDGLLLSIHIADPSPWPLGVWGHLEAIERHAPEHGKPVVVVPVGTEQSETRARLGEVEHTLVVDDIRQAMTAFGSVHAVARNGEGGEQ